MIRANKGEKGFAVSSENGKEGRFSFSFSFRKEVSAPSESLYIVFLIQKYLQ
jgi:hypothetical protein